MSHREKAFWVIYKKYRPHLLMVLVEVAVTLLYFLIEASFNKVMNLQVFVTYRHALGGIIVLPFAYVLERKARPKLTMAMFMELFLLSLLGFSLTLNMYFASLKCTSPSFVTSMVNTISALTFIIAVALRLEAVDVKNPRGVAKILGTLLSLAGALTMTLYKGHAIPNLKGAPILIRGQSGHTNWIKGSILTVASCISWSVFYLMQSITVKKYPAKLSLTAWINCIGAVQSAAFTLIVEHKLNVWFITSSIELWCVLYAFWTTDQKGPVFVSMFNPLGTVLVSILAYFVMGEQLHLGSILGGVIVVIGLYLLLWGKESDQDYKSRQLSSFNI
ncbi:WAT1-related protein At4g08290-like isoform X2 [Prosopis cineraria]|uniref:WAT1-related protein At4g08290-like isoform X2 n=1 Tax=Prosopis cineraria TaxID=364024 RepID=UPI00240ED6EC|nr:WAT1-related protein At4g08290-like isoform X2 [Prosopis cineraria]